MSSERKPKAKPQARRRRLDQLVRQIESAMEVLSQASCGAIGPTGATLEEMEESWNAGRTYGDDSYYDTCQHAWRLLEIAVAMSNPTGQTVPHKTARKD